MPEYCRATSGGLDALLREPGVIDDQHTGRVTEILDHVVAHDVDIPAHRQPLHPVGRQVTGLLSQSPAVSSGQPRDLEACIPNIVTALLVFPVIYLVLGRVGLRAEDRIIRRVEQVVASGGVEGVAVNDVSGVADMVHAIVKRIPARDIVRLEIIGFTGGTFTTNLLRDLLQTEGRRFELTLRIIDFGKAERELMPPHWEREAEETCNRLPALSPNRVKLEIWQYPTLPFMLGLMINECGIFVAFPPWGSATGKLAGKSLEYRFYERSTSTEHIFKLFENWANQPRQVRYYPSGSPRGENARGGDTRD